nr:uncharacterized protein LOC128682642 [Plodia interpunctella]
MRNKTLYMKLTIKTLKKLSQVPRIITDEDSVWVRIRRLEWRLYTVISVLLLLVSSCWNWSNIAYNVTNSYNEVGGVRKKSSGTSCQVLKMAKELRRLHTEPCFIYHYNILYTVSISTLTLAKSSFWRTKLQQPTI